MKNESEWDDVFPKHCIKWPRKWTSSILAFRHPKMDELWSIDGICVIEDTGIYNEFLQCRLTGMKSSSRRRVHLPREGSNSGLKIDDRTVIGSCRESSVSKPASARFLTPGTMGSQWPKDAIVSVGILDLKLNSCLFEEKIYMGEYLRLR